MASNVLQAVCYFHQYYNLCDRKCKHKKAKCPLMNAAAATGTATQEPSFYRIGEERRHNRRERTKRQWMIPPALAGLRMT